MCVNVSKMKTRIGLSFFLCLVVTIVLVKAQDDATEITDIVDENVDVLNSDIAEIEDVKVEENDDEELDDDDYGDDETVPAEEAATSENAPSAAPVEDEIVEDDPVESIKVAESVEEIATQDATNAGTAAKPSSKSRSGNYQYDEFFGNLDTFNTDGGYNGGGDPNYNYGELKNDRPC